MNQQDAPKINVDTDAFLLHPEHRNFVLGKSKYLGRTGAVGVGCLIIFFGFFLCIGTMFLGLSLRDTYEWFMISRQGVSNSAQYVDRRISSNDDSDTYFVSFKYRHNGIEYSCEQAVDWNIYSQAEVGRRIDIVYVPSNPQLAKVAGTNSPPTVMLLFVLVWNAVVYTIIFFALRQYFRMKFLERNGKLLHGQIIRSTSSTDSDGDLSLKVEYAFYVVESKNRITKTESAQRNDLKGNPLPAPGTLVVVLYYNEHRYMLL